MKPENTTSAVAPPFEQGVGRPALGYKHHAGQLRAATASGVVRMNDTADFIEAQNAEIEYLYAALQQVRNRCGGNQRGIGKVASDVRDIVDAALRYKA